jgi:prepilin-type N-terminal cleavage/methylation domain-containing protein/prepilin-type processing-associated H-X9-DG protein
MKTQKAFTLVELLVVISIIALLLSILMPSLSKAREQAKTTVCKSNLKQVNVAAMLWSIDNDDWALPADYAGFSKTVFNSTTSIAGPFADLMGYTNTKWQTRRGLFCCPSAKVSAKYYNSIPRGNTVERVTYGINGWIATNQSGVCPGTPGSTDREAIGSWGEGPNGIYLNVHGVTKMKTIRRPQDTIYFMDFENMVIMYWTFNPFINPIRLAVPMATRWHSKKPNQWYGYGNIAWVDGHVSKEPDDLAMKPQPGQLPRYYYYFYNH